MASLKQDEKAVLKKETSHAGTIIGVGFVGIVILVSYITLYALYLARV